MEFDKTCIHMNRVKQKKVLQVSFDDNCIISDNHPDAKRIITYQAQAVTTHVKTGEGRILVSGTIRLCYLYQGENEGMPVREEGNIPFQETIRMEGLKDRDVVNLEGEVSDVTVSLVHSRKISVRGILTLQGIQEEIYDENVLAHPLLEKDNAEEDILEIHKKEYSVATLTACQKEEIHVREEHELSKSDPGIKRILWCENACRNFSYTPMEDRILVQGEVQQFVMYEPEEAGPALWKTYNLPIREEVMLSGIHEDMLLLVNSSLEEESMEAGLDEDGECRIIHTEFTIELQIQSYKELRVEVIQDVNSCQCQMECEMRKTSLKQLVGRNQFVKKVNQRIHFSGDNRVLQCLNISAQIRKDEAQTVGNGILFTGALETQILAVTDSDEMPYVSEKAMLPLESEIEMEGIDKGAEYTILPRIMQLNCSPVGNEEVEIRGEIVYDFIVFRQQEVTLLEKVEEHPLDYKQVRRLPAMCIHVVKPEETLLEIAKKYCTTVKSIMEINHLESQEIGAGTRLLLLKKVAIKQAL